MKNVLITCLVAFGLYYGLGREKLPKSFVFDNNSYNFVRYVNFVGIKVSLFTPRGKHFARSEKYFLIGLVNKQTKMLGGVKNLEQNLGRQLKSKVGNVTMHEYGGMYYKKDGLLIYMKVVNTGSDSMLIQYVVTKKEEVDRKIGNEEDQEELFSQIENLAVRSFRKVPRRFKEWMKK